MLIEESHSATACPMVGKVNINNFRKSSALPLSCVHHISRVCSNLKESLNFYENVLGFFQIKRPGFDFDGAWLFNYGIGIHLLQSENGTPACEKEIDPRADHVSFLCEDMALVEESLKQSGIKYVRRVVEEGGIMVDQLFFHDPDAFMIEVCNCDKLPVVLLSSCKRSSSLSSPLGTSIEEILPNSLQSGNTLKHSLSGTSPPDQNPCPTYGIVIDCRLKFSIADQTCV